MKNKDNNNPESALITQFLANIRAKAYTLSVVFNSKEVETVLSDDDYADYIDILDHFFVNADINYADYSYKRNMSNSFDLVVDGITVTFSKYHAVELN